jgi:hypothetical protein
MFDYKEEKEKLKKEIYEILLGVEYTYKPDDYILLIIKELDEKSEYFKKRLKNELNNELPEDIKKEIYELKAQIGKEKSEWKIRGNSASRWASNGLKFETCILPINFDIKKMEIYDITGKNGEIYFTYPNDIEKSKRKNLWIYTELYDYLKDNKPRTLEEKEILEHKEMKDLKIESIKNWEDMKNYMISKGVSPEKYMKKMGIFLLNLKGKTFTVEDIDKAIGFNNRKTRQVYIKKFIDLDLIESTKIKRVYRKKFDIS